MLTLLNYLLYYLYLFLQLLVFLNSRTTRIFWVPEYKHCRLSNTVTVSFAIYAFAVYTEPDEYAVPFALILKSA